MTSVLDKLKSRSSEQLQQSQRTQQPPAPRALPGAGLGLGVTEDGRPVMSGFVDGDNAPQDSITYADQYRAPAPSAPLSDAQREGIRVAAALASQGL